MVFVSNAVFWVLSQPTQSKILVGPRIVHFLLAFHVVPVPLKV